MPSTDDVYAHGDLEAISRVIRDARSPLTTISARAQLLHRRIDHGWIDDPQSCLGGLESIHRAAQELEARLLNLEQIVCACEARRNATNTPHDT